MQLDELEAYKNQLMKDLLTNEAIVHLINAEIPFSESKKLAYTQVFPYEYVNETLDKGDTLVLFDVDIEKSVSSTILKPIIYVWVIVHGSQMRLPGGGNRIDRLCCEINKVLNGSSYYGLTPLELTSVRREAPMTDIIAKRMTYFTQDWNRTYDPHRSVPSERRKGK